MVSKRELEYVNKYAKTVPFPGNNYAYDAMQMLINAYDTYIKNYQGKSYDFIFSNGEEINFQIFEKNLAHLFGIDYKTLIGMYKNNTFIDIYNDYDKYNNLKYDYYFVDYHFL